MSQNEILVSLFSYNEGEKLKGLVAKFPLESPYDILFIDDGSTDGSYEFLLEKKLKVIRHESNRGIGFGIREAVSYGRQNGYKIIVIMASNGKMLPEEINRLTEPLQKENYDYIQGSRYLAGGQSPNLPLFRKAMIGLFTMIVNLFMGYKGTDITCGFRAYRLDIFDNPNFNLNQTWLDKYEMEYYIHYYVIKSGYKIKEVPVSMVYPEGTKDYSKIRPFIGWWSMIRPWIYLVLKIRR
jgi:dolichol-phosphate mannosyltransferase